jgi:hypothetical protein
MLNANIFDTKVIYDEAELEGMPFVAPETRRGSSFIEALSNKAGLKKVIGKDAGLGKSVKALANFKKDPAISVATNKVVFIDEFFRDVGEFNAYIFGIRHGRVQIEVFEVGGAEASTFSGEDTVEEELDEFKQGRVGANIARIADSVAANGGTGAVRVILFRMNLADDHGVADLLALVGWDVLVVNEEEGVGTCYPLTIWRRAQSNALTKGT